MSAPYKVGDCLYDCNRWGAVEEYPVLAAFQDPAFSQIQVVVIRMPYGYEVQSASFFDAVYHRTSHDALKSHDAKGGPQ